MVKIGVQVLRKVRGLKYALSVTLPEDVFHQKATFFYLPEETFKKQSFVVLTRIKSLQVDL